MRSIITKVEKNKKKNFYKKIKWLKIISKLGYNIEIEYIEKIYNQNSLNIPKEIEEFIKIVKVINAKSKKEKLSLAYDYACDYLDEQFINKKICDFKNDMCISNRQKEKEKQVNSCCVSTTTKQVCSLFDKKTNAVKQKILPVNYMYVPLYVRKK